ncbi:MAG: hypothetical protein IPM82_11775 [Saprospiraceae bacterium]|nr:hypothetical protein [Saprospiraceae bacterium]
MRQFDTSEGNKYLLFGYDGFSFFNGTYEGYKLENGRWYWVEKFWTETMEEAPRPEPVLDSRGEKDVFGKEKKKGKSRP